MLIRYAQDKKGKTVKKALVYTANEHGIKKDLIDPDALRIVNHLRYSGYEAYIVGGAVRDLLIGKKPKDFDIVTDAEPTRIKRVFRNSRIIGKRFRLVHIFFGDKIFEVSTFRSLSEGTTGNSFGTMDEDVQRRDFTMNALYYDPVKEQVVDYVGGVKDMRSRVLKPVIPLKVIFQDDPVRMIRAVKYAATTGCTIPFLVRRSLRKNSKLLYPVSASRLTEELIKIINSGNAAPIVREALKYDLFMYLQPAACNMLDGNEKFSAAYEKSLEKLDALVRSGEDVPLGRKLVYLITDLINLVTDWKNPPMEVYNLVYRECRNFVMPMNPPRVALEFAVRYCLREGGIAVRRMPKIRDGRREGSTEKREGHERVAAVAPSASASSKRRRRRRNAGNAAPGASRPESVKAES